MDSNWKRAVFLFDKFSHYHIYNFNKVSSQVETISWKNWETTVLGPVSQKSRNFLGLFRVPQLLLLYLHNAKVISLQTSQSSWFFLYWKHVKRSAFQTKHIAVWQLAFQAQKVLETSLETSPWCVKYSLPVSVCG